jgi:hypothetical protein
MDKTRHDARQASQGDRTAVVEPNRQATPGTVSPPAANDCAPKLQAGTIRAFLSERIHALQAASCLLAPIIGDRVLVCQDGGEAFILAVLARSEGGIAEISVPYADTVTIKARGAISMEAPSLQLAAGTLSVMADKIFQVGDVLTRNFRRIVESVGNKSVHAQTLTTQADNRTAVIAQTDMVSAKSLVQTIDGVATQTSEIALVTARRDVRLDGERVSLG